MLECNLYLILQAYYFGKCYDAKQLAYLILLNKKIIIYTIYYDAILFDGLIMYLRVVYRECVESTDVTVTAVLTDTL